MNPGVISDQAARVHAEHPPIDLHADSLMWSSWLGYDVLRDRPRPPLPFGAFGGHVDIPRMQRGGMSAQFFGLVSLPIMGRQNGMSQIIEKQIDELHSAVSRSNGTLFLARTSEDLLRAQTENRIAGYLGIEGAHALDGNIDRIAHFARRGVRYLGLLHFSKNEAGFPAYGRGRSDTDGLTRWGHEAVRACEQNSVIVDLAHINKRGFLDACAVATRPPIVSHTGVLGAFEHWRNIDDEQLRALADRGGVAGVIFCPRYLGGDGLEPVVKHMRHIINVVGEDACALGSDWDGMIVPSRGLQDPTGLPDLTEALLAAGVSEQAVGKILRDNVLRVLRDNP